MSGRVLLWTTEELMLALMIVFVALLAFEALVWRYGADSRDGNDWGLPKPARRSPSID